MRWRRGWIVGGAAVALLVGLCSGTPASAVDGVAVSMNPVTVDADQSSVGVTVSWSGAVPDQLMFVGICKTSINDVEFRVDRDCSTLAEINPNGTPDGAGTASLEVFRGQDPSGSPWGCYAPDDTAPPGVQKFTTCFVRVTDTSVLNYFADVEAAFTLDGPGRVDPGSGEGDGGPAAAAPTLPVVAAGGETVPSAGSSAPTGDPAPGESIMVAGSATGAGVSITG